MADLVPMGEVQDAHTRSPRNFGPMHKAEIPVPPGLSPDTVMSYPGKDKTIYKFNEKDQGPETVGGKDPWSMSPNELRTLVK